VPRIGHDDFWKEEVALASPGVSAPIIIPGWVGEISVAVFPDPGATCKVVYCIDPETVVEDTPSLANWLDWDAGDVTADTSAPAHSTIVGVRLAVSIGAAKLQVAGTRRAVRIR